MYTEYSRETRGGNNGDVLHIQENPNPLPDDFYQNLDIEGSSESHFNDFLNKFTQYLGGEEDSGSDMDSDLVMEIQQTIVEPNSDSDSDSENVIELVEVDEDESEVIGSAEKKKKTKKKDKKKKSKSLSETEDIQEEIEEASDAEVRELPDNDAMKAENLNLENVQEEDDSVKEIEYQAKAEEINEIIDEEENVVDKVPEMPKKENLAEVKADPYHDIDALVGKYKEILQ